MFSDKYINFSMICCIYLTKTFCFQSLSFIMNILLPQSLFEWLKTCQCLVEAIKTWAKCWTFSPVCATAVNKCVCENGLMDASCKVLWVHTKVEKCFINATIFHCVHYGTLQIFTPCNVNLITHNNFMSMFFGMWKTLLKCLSLSFGSIF